MSQMRGTHDRTKAGRSDLRVPALRPCADACRSEITRFGMGALFLAYESRLSCADGRRAPRQSTHGLESRNHQVRRQHDPLPGSQSLDLGRRAGTVLLDSTSRTLRAAGARRQIAPALPYAM